MRKNNIVCVLRTFAAALILLLLPMKSGAQAISGSLVGTVTDSTGGGVPNASVQATNTGTGVKTAAVTGDRGDYRFNNLPVGTYDIVVTATGFNTTSLKSVDVELNKIATANLTVEVGQVSTSVEVREASNTIDTTTAQVQSTFASKEAQDLPLASIGVGVLNLSLLSSGVASNGGIGVGSGPSVGGQRPRNNNFTIEGIDNNSKVVTGPLILVPNDAVSEFTLLQNQFSPEYGHSSGGQFNTIVKSGTNELHGSVYEYLQNRNLNAIDQAVANQGFRDNPRYDQSRLGATIGGPILKNKLFYFGNFEYNPIGLATTPGAPVSSPTAAGYSALAAIPGLSSTNLGVFKQYLPPAATASDSIQVAGKTIPVGILPISAPNYQDNKYGVASVDYNLSEKDQLRGRFLYNKINLIDTQATLPAFFTLEPQTFYLGTLTEYHNFTPNVTNELRLGYNRYNQDVPAGSFKYPGLDQFPNITIDELNLQIGPDPGAPQFTIQNLYQASDNLSWTKGRHTFKFGFEIRKYISPQFFTQRARGDYDYGTLELFLQDRTPDQLAQRSLGNPTFYGDQIAAYPYINDTWRVRPNLSINLGLRYEYTTIPFSVRQQKANDLASVPGVLEFKEPRPQTTAVAPRIGIAYSPGASGNTSIRAGFGLAYDVIFDNVGILSLPPQFSTTVDAPDVPNFLKNGGITPNAGGVGQLSPADARAATANYVPIEEKLPYSIQWNLGIQHVFAKSYTFEARYLGTRGVHLLVQDRLNKVAPVTPANSLPTYVQRPSQAQLDALTLTLAQLQAQPSTLPQFAKAGFTNSIVGDLPVGNSTYHGLALQLDRRFSNGLLFKAAYTWSHLIDDSTAEFFTTLLTPRRPQDFQNLRADRSSSALDRRHRFTLSAIYDLPFFKSGNWFMKNIAGNWEIAPVYIFESPEYATVQSARDANLNGDTFSDRTVINPSGASGVGTDVTALKNSKGDVVGYLANNPNARYIRAGAGVFPNGGRNTLPLRRINNWDLTLLKRFAVTERIKLELQGQFLNAFNHPQFTPGFVDRVDNPVVLNNGPGVRNFLTPGRPEFNNPEGVFGSNPRVIQVVGKITF